MCLWLRIWWMRGGTSLFGYLTVCCMHCLPVLCLFHFSLILSTILLLLVCTLRGWVVQSLQWWVCLVCALSLLLLLGGWLLCNLLPPFYLCSWGVSLVPVGHLLLSLWREFWLYDACNFMLSGKYISSCNFPFIVRFMSSVAKFDVALKSITNLLLVVFLLNVSIYLRLCFLLFELVLLCWFLQRIHLLLFCGVGPSSSWLPGKCDLCLFYSIALFLVATSLFLV